MNKERLDFLKKTINQDFTERHDIPQLHFNQSDLRWLIEQAELVGDFDKLDDEYQKDIASAEAAKRSYKKQRDSLKEENARLREALEFYADKERYEMWECNTGNHLNNEWTNDVSYDNGDKARQVLEDMS